MGYLASAEDANRSLDQSKLAFDDDTDAEPEAIQADAIVRASLSDIYPANAHRWGNEDAVPAVVNVIAAMLMASLRYSKVYSEEALSENDHSARLWERAMKLITDLREGNIEIGDVEVVKGLAFGRDDFWPNDLTVDKRGNPLRAFTLEKEF